MIITKRVSGYPNGYSHKYWDGTNDPVNLHITSYQNNNDYHVRRLSLIVLNYRVYALTHRWAIMLYDSTVSGDEVNIIKRIRPYCQNNVLIVKYCSNQDTTKIFYCDSGASICDRYNGNGYSMMTHIRGSSIDHRPAEHDSSYHTFTQNNASDILTHELWWVTSCPGMDPNFNMTIKLTNSGKTVCIHVNNFNDTIVGIVDNFVIVRSHVGYEGIAFISISIHDPTDRRIIASKMMNVCDSLIRGYLLYVTSMNHERDDITMLHIIDVRNGHRYDFMHQHE